ncbi:hypothetical protein GCM10027217_25780 [Pseudomaricurvus hydrocarbonicus]
MVPVCINSDQQIHTGKVGVQQQSRFQRLKKQGLVFERCTRLRGGQSRAECSNALINAGDNRWQFALTETLYFRRD